MKIYKYCICRTFFGDIDSAPDKVYIRYQLIIN